MFDGSIAILLIAVPGEPVTVTGVHVAELPCSASAVRWMVPSLKPTQTTFESSGLVAMAVMRATGPRQRRRTVFMIE